MSATRTERTVCIFACYLCLLLGSENRSYGVDVIDFESPTYTLSDPNDTTNVLNPFRGQDGWVGETDSSTGNPEDAVVATPTSGQYAGGQAIGHIDASGIGRFGKLGFSPLFNGNMMQADFFGGDSAFRTSAGFPVGFAENLFDNDGQADTNLRIGGWVDANDDEIYNFASGSGERGFLFGLDSLNAAVGRFAIEFANSTGEITSTDGGQSGTLYSPDTWYRITASWVDNVVSGKDVTITAFDLTNNNDLGTVISATLTDAEFGHDPNTYEGIGFRTTRGLLDNLQGTNLVSENADFDSSNSVDGLDFLIWQTNVGTGSTQAEGDANNDGIVNDADLGIWEVQYGGAPLSAVSVVPEPGCSTLLGLSLLVVISARKKRPLFPPSARIVS